MPEQDNLFDEDYELIDLEDEDGNTVTFEIFQRMEFNGAFYYALTPYSESENVDDDEIVFLKESENDGEKYLASIDSDEEYQQVADAFFENFFEILDTEEEE